MTPNARLAAAVLGDLAALGVRDFVVCAGARNAPLVGSLLLIAARKKWTVRHHFDERSAAFFAMGLAKRGGAPVAVLTTSGTAVAELLAATVEAYYSGIPLILVTADRPVTFRGSGAPQAIEQVGILGPYAPLSLDVTFVEDLEPVARWSRKDPLHLNICFDEPTPDDVGAEIEEKSFPSLALGIQSEPTLLRFCETADRLVVILGELPASWQSEVETFLLALGAPVWAEATSGLRESALLQGQLIKSERHVATSAARQVLRLGGIPSLRFWRDLETRPEIAVLSCSPLPFSGLARESDLQVSATFPGGLAEKKEGWSDALTLSDDDALEAALEKHPFSEPAMVRELSRQVPGEALVFLGNSLPIREWNLAAQRDKAHPRTFASRGANGIDGQIATFLGMAEGEAESWGIFGDLTALCDLNAPALLDPLSPGKRRLVILNNEGGRIFSRLSAMAGLSEEHKEITENRHTRRFEAWAAMWGLAYVPWTAGSPFPDIGGESVVIEVLLDTAATEAFWEALS